ncbi:hypothetical protein V2J09_024265 [Rumex salicifolius]
MHPANTHTNACIFGSLQARSMGRTVRIMARASACRLLANCRLVMTPEPRSARKYPSSAANVGSSRACDVTEPITDLARETAKVVHPPATQARWVHVDLKLGSPGLGGLMATSIIVVDTDTICDGSIV